jgi:peptidoglycan/LPS O-acetylase OafA/YrhL
MNLQETPTQGKPIGSLTSLRFFAALAVFFVHVNLFPEGYLGVTFFFILSGFILAYNYAEIFTAPDRKKIQGFYWNRFARIYPLHLLTFLISIPLVYAELKAGKTWLLEYYPSQPNAPFVDAIANLTLLQSFSPFRRVYAAYNEVSWSISAEFFFYALFPLIIVLWSKLRLNHQWQWLAALLTIWVTATLVEFIFRDAAFNHWLLYISPPARLADFLLGIILCSSFKKLQSSSRVRSLSGHYYVLLEVATILALLLALYFAPYFHLSFRYDMYYAPFMSLIIIVFALQKGVLSKLLAHPNLVWLGEISFSFYMLHQLILRGFNLFLINQNFFNGSINILFLDLSTWTTLFILLCTLLLSYGCWRYCEIPARRTIKSYVRSHELAQTT